MYDNDIQSFLNQSEKEEGRKGGIKWTPTQYRLNGLTGKFLVKEFDPNISKMKEEAELGKEEWGGVIIGTTYFSQKKYKQEQTNTFRTREFQSFQTDPIELLEITFGEGGATKVKANSNYPNYAAFKDAKTPKDPETGEKMASPYELRCALYVYIPSKKETVKYIIKGSTVSAWFDYSKKYSEQLEERPRTLKQVKTLFTISEPKLNESTGIKFYTVNFKAHSVCTNDEMKEVIEANNKLKEWQDSWKTSTVAVPEKIAEPMLKSAVHTVLEHEEDDTIQLDQIPF